MAKPIESDSGLVCPHCKESVQPILGKGDRLLVSASQAHSCEFCGKDFRYKLETRVFYLSWKKGQKKQGEQQTITF